MQGGKPLNLSRKEKASALAAFGAYIAWQNVDEISSMVMRLVTGVLDPKAGLLVFGVPIQTIMYAAFGLLMLIGILSLFGFRFRRNGNGGTSAPDRRKTVEDAHEAILKEITKVGKDVGLVGRKADGLYRHFGLQYTEEPHITIVEPTGTED